MTQSDREITTSRVISAPREIVFRAFSDPEQLAKWWGPAGFTNTFREFDFRPGGYWRFVMHGPDGTDYTNESVFDEITPPERIVFTHLRTMHKFEMTLTFKAEGDKTRLGWRMLFETVEECEKVKVFVVAANEQNLDRLETHLAGMA